MSVTFVMLKPDAVENHLSYRILEYFRKNGIGIECFDVMTADEQKIRAHYAEHIAKYGEDFARKMFDQFVGKTVVPIILRGGDDVIADVRRIVGATEPGKAEIGTIRRDLGNGDTYAISVAENRVVINLIHASDSIENVKREAGIWLPGYKFD